MSEMSEIQTSDSLVREPVDAVEPAAEPPRLLNPYDELPYGGRAVPLTHPEHLAILAMRRGLSPATPAKCRILELGCAEGGNVLPLAFHLAESQVLGVDASAVQIAAATEARDRLGLDNLTLRHADILDLGDDLGTFDYILCHGVFSWVPEPVREKILAVCGKHLAPHGVAYISYNCRPGWAFRGLMRRALMERARGAKDPEDRIARVREALAWMAESPFKETPWGAMLAGEAAAVLDHRDPYLVHEYLSEENEAFHFREVYDRAQTHGLGFLAEMSRAASDPRLEDGVAKSFAAKVEDPVEAEELSELFLFRAFRCTLFCRAEALEATPARPSPELAGGVRFAGQLRPVSQRLSLEPGVHEFFETPAGVKISAQDPVLKASLLEVGRAWPRGLHFRELTDRVQALLEVRRVLSPDETIPPERVEALGHDLMELGRLDYLDLRMLEPEVTPIVSAAPRASALTRLEAERGDCVTSPHHRVVVLDKFAQLLVRYLDGARGHEQLAALMLQHVDAGDVSLLLESGEKLAGPELEQAIAEVVSSSLDGLARRGLLWG